MAELKTSDPLLFSFLEGERKREREGVELIPSENYVSRPVLEALGSEFTNKYSEGYPGRRYYGGQEFTDKVETETIERAKAIFGADHVNVQVSSGAAANVATFFAWLEPGDTVLGMDLNHGGHLTHGSPVTYMSKLFNFVRYGMKDIETGEIDYDALRAMAIEHKPKIIIAGFSAYPRELDYKKIADIANEVGAVAMADMAHIAGLIAGGVLANPFDHGFHIITTTTHKSLRGPRGAMVMSKGTVGNPLKKPEKTIENLPTLIDRSVFPGLQGGPHMHQTLAIGVALGEAQRPEFKVYAQQVVDNAKVLADALMARDFRLITNGTDNHLILADVFGSFGIGGKEAEKTLDKIGLTLNKNSIANDTRKPFDPSGIRLGTPAMTTRGFKESDMEQVAIWMKSALDNRKDDKILTGLASEVKDYCLKFPIPSDN
ncbi:serine hydroxymethyltransferase [Candidatus Saccharibacteria bacterium]|nr:serine hydroxymethyltransferase [Candidatus Saccharibacteria bacterium]